MNQELIYQLAVLIFGGGCVYGGIRADLKAMHERISQAKESATAAHQRIDSLIGNRRHND